MRHRTALGRTGSARLGAAAVACTALAALVFHAPQLHAAPAAGPTTVAEAASAAALAAGACRLGRWAAAVDLLRVVERQKLRAEDWLCLARAELHSGQWVAALDSYDELSESDASLPRDRVARELGAAERQDLEGRLAWIRIAPSAPVPSGVELSLDGESVSRSRLGAEFPVQPGVHAFRVKVQGVVRELEHFQLAQGERRTLNLSVPARPASSEAPTPVAARQAVAPRNVARRQPPAPSATKRWADVALYAGGVGTIGGFLVMVAGSGNKPHGVAVAGASGMVVGGLSLMTSSVLHLMDAAAPSRKEAPVEEKGVQVQPWISTHAAGVSGSF